MALGVLLGATASSDRGQAVPLTLSLLIVRPSPAAMRVANMENSDMIVAIDVTRSNEATLGECKNECPQFQRLASP